MYYELIFFISFILGGILAYLLYKYKENQKQQSFKVIEMELVENLKELKKQIEPTDDKKFSKEFDLVELSLNYEFDDIVITNDEGFIIASTYEDSDEFGSTLFRIFENIKDYLKKVKKVVIQSDEYIIIYPIEYMNEEIYIITKTKILPNPVEEKKFLDEIKHLLDNKYLHQLRTLENISDKFITKTIDEIEGNVTNI
ncbi:roadblock/LC7 domain-containing protein [Methanocaldococcus indicus]|uniref:roadblock/LC7 domain-containing protein n=1 Tax=Methanocaldococcus indicus TaxID=213231 RepID=UPI003C6CD182